MKKCLRVPEEQIPMEDLNASEDLSYRVTYQDFRDMWESYPEQEDEVVQGEMESP
jgi:hypothetical protein